MVPVRKSNRYQRGASCLRQRGGPHWYRLVFPTSTKDGFRHWVKYPVYKTLTIGLTSLVSVEKPGPKPVSNQVLSGCFPVLIFSDNCATYNVLYRGACMFFFTKGGALGVVKGRALILYNFELNNLRTLLGCED